MATLEVKNITGKSVGELELDDSVFGVRVHEHLLWETVKWQLAKRRSGTHSTKLRGEVSGTTKKPFKQKGTGRARAGSTRAAQWVGGGIIFGPRPRKYGWTMPRKAKKVALRSALSLRASEEKLVIVDELGIEGGKTKAVAAALANLGVSQPDNKVLIVDSKDNELLVRGAKNLKSSKWLAPEGLNVYDILNHQTLVMSSAAAKLVEGQLKA